MRILDRYLIQGFLHILGFALIAFLLIFIVVDLVEHLDEFLDKKVPKPMIVQYYIYYLPYIIILCLPVAMLLSSLFSIGQLARYNELTAMKSTGISLYRIAAPLLILAFLIAVAAFFFGEWIVPESSAKRLEIKRVFLDKLPPSITTKMMDIYIQEEGRRVRIRFYDKDEKVAYRVSVENFRAGYLTSRIDAKRMVWRGKRWILKEGFKRIFKGQMEEAVPFDEISGMNLDFSPEELSKPQKEPDEMSYAELRGFVRKIREYGCDPKRWLVDLYLKIAFPFANLIIVLFGVPLASSRKRSGAAVGFGISLFICFVYFGVIRISQSLGQQGTLPPVLAAWLGNILFGTIGITLLFKVRK